MISKKKTKAITKLLNDLLLNPKVSDIDVYDLIGEMLLICNQGYKDKFYEKIKNNLTNFLSIEHTIEMERRILEKFCLFEEENIITAFNGKIILYGARIIGRIYLTNYRIIAQGVLKVAQGSGLTSGTIGGVSYSIDSYGESNSSEYSSYSPIGYNRFQDTKRLSFIKNQPSSGIGTGKTKELLDTHDTMRQTSPEKKLFFGYHYPIINSFKVKRKKDTISYKTTVEYELGKKIKEQTIRIGISPSKEKGEKLTEFKARREKVLSILEKAIRKDSLDGITAQI